MNVLIRCSITDNMKLSKTTLHVFAYVAGVDLGVQVLGELCVGSLDRLLAQSVEHTTCKQRVLGPSSGLAAFFSAFL